MPIPRFILVRPLYPGNAGGAARAICNFGWEQLRLVRPAFALPHEEATRFAVGGRAVLQGAQIETNLAAAVDGTRLVIGTSRRAGKRRPNFFPIEELGTVLRDVRPKDAVAILFGSEEKGLTNEELRSCQVIVTIPTVAACPSLNLAHAVALVAYEFRRAMAQAPQSATRDPLAPVEQLRDLFVHWRHVLDVIEFFPHGQPENVMRRLRHLFGRTQLTQREVGMLRGIARQIMKGVTEKR